MSYNMKHDYLSRTVLRLLMLAALVVAALPVSAWDTKGPKSGTDTYVADPGGGTYFRQWNYEGDDFNLDFTNHPSTAEYFSCTHPTFTWAEPYIEFKFRINGTQEGSYPQTGYNFFIGLSDGVYRSPVNIARVNYVGDSKTFRTQYKSYLSQRFNFMPEMINTDYGLVRIVSQEGTITGRNHDYPIGDVKITLRFYPNKKGLKRRFSTLVVHGTYWYEGKVDDARLWVQYKKAISYAPKMMTGEVETKMVGPHHLKVTVPAVNASVPSTNDDTRGQLQRSVAYSFNGATIAAKQSEKVSKVFSLANPAKAATFDYKANISDNFKYDHMISRRLNYGRDEIVDTDKPAYIYNEISEPAFTNEINGTTAAGSWSVTVPACASAKNLHAVFHKWGSSKVSLAWDSDEGDGNVNKDGKWYVYRTPTTKDGVAIGSGSRKLIATLDYKKRSYDDTSMDADKYYVYEVAFGANSWESDYWDAENDVVDELASQCSVVNTATDVTIGSLTLEQTPEGKSGVTIGWKSEKIGDSSLKYTIHRRVGDNGRWEDNYATVGVESNDTTFTDTKALSMTTPYYYFVSVEAMNKEFKSETLKAYYKAQSRLTSIVVSPGYYSDKVTVDFSVDHASTDSYKLRVSRMLKGMSASNFREIGSVETADSKGTYEDKEVKPGNIYEYKVELLEKDSEGNWTAVDERRTVGFCRSTGVISGRVTYGTGAAVEGARVTVTGDTNDVPSGKRQFALRVNTSSKGLSWTPAADSYSSLFAADKAFALQLWVNPDSEIGAADASQPQPSVATVGGAFELRLVPDGAAYRLQVMQDGKLKATTANIVVKANAYTHLTASYDKGMLRLTARADESLDALADSVKLDAWSLSTDGQYTFNVAGNASGKESQAYKGYIDDIRLWGKALSDKEEQGNYDRLLGGSETGLKAYWPLDENLDNLVFDYSFTDGLANCNTPEVDMSMKSNAFTPKSLNIYGLTDSQGNYVIRGIPFSSEGTNYIIRPSLGTHEFSPSHRTSFISSNTLTSSGTDFGDVSSFAVSGTVVYAGTNYPVEGAMLKVDGSYATREGEVVKTDEQGRYTISVPIGDHFISVELNNHEFVNKGRYPATGTVNFDRAITGLTFEDATTVVLAGRVTGGDVEGQKPVGFGSSLTTVGQAEIALKASDLYYVNAHWNGTRYEAAATEATVDAATDMTSSTAWRGKGEQNAHRIFIKTDPLTGEFSAKVPPLKYTLESVDVKKNKAVSFSDLPKVIDLTNAGAKYSDSLKVAVADGDSVMKKFEYNYKLLETFYDPTPTFTVSQTDTVGSAKWGMFGMKKYVSPNGDEEVDNLWTVDEASQKATYTYGYPLFQQGEPYEFLIEAYDTYTNYDGDEPVVTKVPQKDVVVTISNPMASSQSVVMKSDDADIQPGKVYDLKSDQMKLNAKGQGKYTWSAGFPNLTKPFTRTINITGVINNRNMSAPSITGVVLGCVPTGNNFVTEGPDRIINVLRDPPASGSKLSIENDTIQTEETVTTWNAGLYETGKVQLLFGQKISVIGGMTVIKTTDIKWEQDLDITSEQKWTRTNKVSRTITSKNVVSTSGSSSFVSSRGDVFVGYSTNIIVGDGRYVTLQATGSGDKKYEIAETSGKVLDSKMKTTFHYTQWEIENKMIPGWKTLRDNILGRAPKAASREEAEARTNSSATPIYVTWLDKSDKHYGEDDTYVMVPPAMSPEGTQFVDSVAYMNQQIDSWKKYLAQNEEDKVKAFSNKEKYFKENLSFDSGSSITRSYSVKDDSSYSKNYTWSLKTITTGKSGYAQDNFGFIASAGVGPGGGTGSTDTSTKSYLHNYSYTLIDANDKVDLTVDVYNSPMGWSPIFRVRGGQTRCPYEAEERTKYFEPEKKDDNHIINFATLQMEKPKIACDERVKTDVPSGTAAVFKLKLTNESEAALDQTYLIKVIEGTNTKGANIKMDGSPFNRNLFIAAGKTTEKTFTIEQTDRSITKFEDIKIVLASTCQNSSVGIFPGIGDTIKVSVYYAPTSSDVKLTVPHTLVNSVTGGSQNLTIGGFDRSFKDFYGLRLQYQPEGSSAWTTLHEYVLNPKDSTSLSQSVIPSTGNITYALDMSDYANWPDGNYLMRVQSVTRNGNSEVTKESEVFTLTKDMECPKPLGLPLPKNGLLKAGDDIAVNFNEDILKSLLTSNNVVVTGELNEQPVEHSTALQLNGTLTSGDAPVEGTALHGSITESVYNLGNCDYTLEMWLKRTSSGEIVSHGNSGNRFALSVDQDGHLVAEIDDLKKVSAQTIPSGKWVFLACSYKGSGNYPLNAVMAYDDQTATLFDNVPMQKYSGKGVLSMGRSLKGYVSEMSLWNYVRPSEESLEEMHTTKSATTSGLVGYWKFDEGHGSTAADKTGRNNIYVGTNSWWTDCGNLAATLDGTNAVEIPLASISTLQKDSYAVEMWFKTAKKSDSASGNSADSDSEAVNSAISQQLFSVATKKTTVLEAGLDVSGNLYVTHNNATEKLNASNLNDSQWHHFALNVQRGVSAIAYIDGGQVGMIPEKSVPALVGSVMTVGKGLRGAVDEVKVWNANLTGKYLADHRYERADTAKVHGLVAYYPFDRLKQDEYHQWNTEFSLADMCGKSVASAPQSESTADAPMMQRDHKLSVLNTSFTASERSIYITVNNVLREYDGTTLNFEVSGVRDTHGNVSRPIIWSALVDLNTLKWGKDSVLVNKGDTGSRDFKVDIVNNGSTAEYYLVSGLPDWLESDDIAGILEPQKSKTLHFTVKETTSVGTHEQTIFLTGNNSISEPLLVTAKVRAPKPEWNVNPSDFEHSMNVVAQVFLNNHLLDNNESIVAAFRDGECVGVAQPQYIVSRDSYYATLTVYGKSGDNGKDIEFRTWDVNTGMTYTRMKATPSVCFRNDALYGSFSSPVRIENGSELEQHVSLRKGWNWMSVYVMPDNPAIATVMQDISASVSTVKRPKEYATWDEGEPFGSLTAINPGLMYNVEMLTSDELKVYGSKPTEEQSEIRLNKGWSWIGSTMQSTMSLQNALTGADPQVDDMIKSQKAFAIYNGNLWEGNLQNIEPGQGYKYSSQAEAKTFHFPNTLTAQAKPQPGVMRSEGAANKEHWWFTSVDEGAYPDNMTLVAQARDGGEVVDTLEIAAFVGDECRATAHAINNRWYLAILGDTDGDLVTFRTFLNGHVATFAHTETFGIDKNVGTPKSPVILDIATATAIRDLQSSGIGLWPRVASTSVTVSAETAIASVAIYSTAGNMVKKLTPNAPSARINIGDIARGHYLVRVTLDNGTCRTERFTKLP